MEKPDYSSFLSDERKQKFEDVINKRTRHITVVLEKLNKGHNISACLRTCEAMGIHDVHVIENRSKRSFDRKITQGAHHWLNIAKYDEDANWVDDICSKGYEIAVSVLDESAVPISQLPVDRPLALVFGNEKDGITKSIIDKAKYRFYIPMHGFVQSFNISVALAICLNSIVTKLHNSDVDWGLPGSEKLRIIDFWTERDVKARFMHKIKYRSHVER